MTYEERLEQIASDVQSVFAYDKYVDADMVISIMIDRLKDTKDLKDAYEKQNPKKPTIYGVEGAFNEDCEFVRWSCPACGAVTLSEYSLNPKHRAFCNECGQKILWEDKG